MKLPRCAWLFFVLVPLAVARPPEERLRELGLELPAPASPVANYIPAVRVGNLLFLSGSISRDAAGQTIAGKVGRDLDVKQGAEAAQRATLAVLANVRAQLGGLARVKRIVRVGGFVNSAPGFTQQPAVMNGCSDLLVALFGDAGRHARTSVGVAELPLNAAVEVDLVLEVVD